MLPYTAEVLFALYDEYNRAIRPLPALALFLAATVIAVTIRSKQDRRRPVLLILAAGWLWCGFAWHAGYFWSINFAAPVYGALFAVQGCLLAWSATVRRTPAIRFRGDFRSRLGVGIAITSAAVLPAADWWMGIGWTDARFALIAPGATAGLTAGVLLLAQGRIPAYLIFIPVLWLIGAGVQAWVLNIPQDFIFPAIGVAAASAALRSRRPDDT